MKNGSENRTRACDDELLQDMERIHVKQIREKRILNNVKELFTLNYDFLSWNVLCQHAASY